MPRIREGMVLSKSEELLESLTDMIVQMGSSRIGLRGWDPVPKWSRAGHPSPFRMRGRPPTTDSNQSRNGGLDFFSKCGPLLPHI